VTSADLGRLLTRRAPLFNQPNELASDVYGTENALRAGYHEEGALLMLRFFRARTRQSLSDALVFGFERTHPHPDVRIPAVEQTARTWRLSGGRSLPKLPNVIL
jgi:predicted Zn-dependent protease